jgi:hypothetical protein
LADFDRARKAGLLHCILEPREEPLEQRLGRRHRLGDGFRTILSGDLAPAGRLGTAGKPGQRDKNDKQPYHHPPHFSLGLFTLGDRKLCKDIIDERAFYSEMHNPNGSNIQPNVESVKVTCPTLRKNTSALHHSDL